jgi:hypothetical protein
MSAWSAEELDRIDRADELEVRSIGADGAISSPRTIWVIRVDDDLYVRSVKGRDSDWFRGTQRRQEGRISAGGVERDVTFVEAEGALEARIDDAYRQKYRRYEASIVATTLTPEARAATLKLAPRDD